jgi:hypothetical protein
MRPLYTIALIATIICFNSCGKDDVPPPPPTVTSISPNFGQTGSTITITGVNFGTDINKVTATFGNGQKGTVATITDTQLTVLAPAQSTSDPITIAVGDQSIQTEEFTFYELYTYGAAKESTQYRATYWIGDQATTISTNYSEIKEMIVVDGHTHVVGYEYADGIASYSTQRYWKDGISIPVEGITPSTRFTGIAVSGTDVYICGVELNSIDLGISMYWKNGKQTILTDVATNETTTSDITVSGSDVYITGSDYPNAVYWKNGVEVTLGNDKVFSKANSISIANEDIYVAGEQIWNGAGNAVIWKNGQLIELTTEQFDIYDRAATVFINGSDVYVGGGHYGVVNGDITTDPSATVWKNGIAAKIQKSNYYTLFNILCISEFKGDIYVTMSVDEFNSPSFIYRNDKEIISSPEFHRKMLGHQLVTY